MHNLIMVIRMIFNRRMYNFIAELWQLNHPHRSFLFYLKYIIKFCKGEKIICHNQQYIVNSLLPPLPSQAFVTFVKAFSKDGDFFTNFERGEVTAPISTYLKITNTCNCSCLFCSAGSGANTSVLSTKKHKLSHEEWKTLINKLQTLGVSYIGFTGGEPLLYPALEDLIATIDQRSVSVVFTNGIYLDYNRACALKKAGLFAVSISLDSANEEKHNQTRGNKAAFKSALQAIVNARKAGLYTIVQSVLFKTELNWESVYSLLKLVKKHGAHELRFHKPALAGAFMKAQERDTLAFNSDDIKALYALQFKANRLLNMPKVSSFPYTEGPERFGCNAGVFHSYITDEGELTPCDFIALTFGNILERNLDELYNNMRQIVGKRKLSCMSAQIAAHTANNAHQLSTAETVALCQKISTEVKDIPKFFKETSSLL